MVQATPALGRPQAVLLPLLALLAGCAGGRSERLAPASPAPVCQPGASCIDAAAGAPVLNGIDVLLAQEGGPLRGRRVGLITNHTGVGLFVGAPRETGQPSTIDLLHEHQAIELVALFSPEHALHGRAAPGEAVQSGRDPRTGLPIHSIYGEVKKPTPEMLEGLDALVFDVQDIGTRYYTYVWTMALAMEAAAENGLEFFVLDRPNPIGGELVQGNVLEPEHATFVGLYPVPMRHGLTAGELARLVNEEFGLGADLTVVPMRGWRRSMWFDDTGLPWIPPSPNMPSLESATHYPGTTLFEGTNLSVGRGTPIAFQQVGAPWLDTDALIRRLEAYRLPGVRFEAVRFTPESPGDRKFDGQQLAGIRLSTTDRRIYDPTRAAVAMLVEIRRLHADSLSFFESHFDRLAGTTRLRQALLAGRSMEEITARWAAESAAFRALSRPYLLYPEDEADMRSTTESRPSTRELARLHEVVRAPGLEKRRFTHAELWSVLDPILGMGEFDLHEIGRSAEGRPIRLVRYGGGPTRVLLWSQMHGDESTATMALADLFAFLAARPDHPLARRLAERLTVLAVPMLNPDGAERFQRRNAHGIDINRDARRLASPEARALKAAHDRWRPDVGFNLHDQNVRTRVGESDRTVAIALLAPAPDASGRETPEMLRAKRIAAVIRHALEPLVAGHIARYDDTHNPRAFGDLVQSWGTSTVLIEAGGRADDPEKQYLRMANFVAILAALDAIATGDEADADPLAYASLPGNGDAMNDLILRGGTLVVAGLPPVLADLAIDYDEPLHRADGRVVDVGDLAHHDGRTVIDATGLFLHYTGDGILRVGAPADFVARRGPAPDADVAWELVAGVPTR